jgi:protein SCO1/2
MRQQRRPRSAKIKLLFFIAGVAGLYGSYYLGHQYAPTKPRFLNLSELAQPQAMKNLVLQDQYGNPFTEQELAGHWNFVMFGQTESAESALDGLTLITQVKNRLALHPDIQQQTRAVFITVNPETDKPEVLEAFMARFSPDYLALTGLTENIQSVARSLGVTIRRSSTPDAKGYRIDHSSSILLIDPDARLIGLFTGVVDAASIAADIQQLALDEAE